MEPAFTFRNMASTDALRAHTLEKISRLHKYTPDSLTIHVILSVEHNSHVAEITFNTPGGQFVGQAESGDMYGSIDHAVKVLETQLRRKKDRVTHHKGHTATADFSAEE